MLSAKDINTLKAKIKSELLRRDGNGSLAVFAGSDYDFNLVPEAGSPVMAEHGQKTIDLILKIAPVNGLKEVKKGDPIPDGFDTELIAHVDRLAAETKRYGAKSSCVGACSGLCISACVSACTSCSGSCEGSCVSCSAYCGGCAGTCSGSCTGCSGGCSGGCTSCTGTCSGGCSGCTTACKGDCTSVCTSCVGYCTRECAVNSSKCAGNCTGMCFGSCGGSSCMSSSFK